MSIEPTKSDSLVSAFWADPEDGSWDSFTGFGVRAELETRPRETPSCLSDGQGMRTGMANLCSKHPLWSALKESPGSFPKPCDMLKSTATLRCDRNLGTLAKGLPLGHLGHLLEGGLGYLLLIFPSHCHSTASGAESSAKSHQSVAQALCKNLTFQGECLKGGLLGFWARKPSWRPNPAAGLWPKFQLLAGGKYGPRWLVGLWG